MRALLALLACLAWTACAQGETVSFLAPDAVRVEARRFGSGESVVVVLPEPGTSPDRWYRLAGRLSAEGLAVWVLHWRPSQDRALLARDVVGVLDEAGEGVALVAEGGSVPLALAATPGRSLAGLVLVSPAPDADLAELARRVAAPKLLASAIGDDQAVETQRLLLANSPPPVEARLYPGSARGVHLLEEAEALTDILAFLTEILEEG